MGMRAPIVIRHARLGELPALEALQMRAAWIWEQYRDDLAAHPDDVRLTDDAIEQSRVRVATSGSERTGFAEWSVTSADEGELEGLFVEPGSMRRGIGGRLLQDVFALARDAGVRRIAVVAEPHVAVVYERVGFLHEDRVETQFGPALRMGLALGV